MTETKLKQDTYRRERGGWARMLEIRCRDCNNVITHYQKDGPGILKRLYVDRMSYPQKITNRLVCSKCKQSLGMLYIYPKERRPAYRLFDGVITHKIVKSN